MNEKLKITDPDKSPISTAGDLMKRVQFAEIGDGPVVFTYVAVGRVANEETRRQYREKWAETYQELWPLLVSYFANRTEVPISSSTPMVEAAMSSGAVKAAIITEELMAGTHPRSPKTITEAEGDWNAACTKIFFAILVNSAKKAVSFYLFVDQVPMDADGFMDIKFHEMEIHPLP